MKKKKTKEKREKNEFRAMSPVIHDGRAQLGRGGLGIVQLQPAMLRNWRPGSTLLAERPGCSFISLGFRSLPLCCCIQRGTPFFWPLSSPSGVALYASAAPLPLPGSALHIHHPASPARRERKRSDPPSSPATRHALPRSDRLVPARIRPDADSPWNRAAESSRCLAATSPTRPPSLVRHSPLASSSSGQPNRHRTVDCPRIDSLRLLIRCFTLVFCASIGAVLRLESSSPLPRTLKEDWQPSRHGIQHAARPLAVGSSRPGMLRRSSRPALRLSLN